MGKNRVERSRVDASVSIRHYPGYALPQSAGRPRHHTMGGTMPSSHAGVSPAPETSTRYLRLSAVCLLDPNTYRHGAFWANLEARHPLPADLTTAVSRCLIRDAVGPARPTPARTS
jgi:hypothetical protein